MPVILCLDPSVRCSGWCVLDLDPRHALLGAGACRTEPGETASTLARVLDEAHRAARWATTLADLLRRYDVALVAAEAPMGSKDVRAAAYLARANQAVVDAVALTRPELVAQRRLMFVSSFGAKHAATGSRRPGRPTGRRGGGERGSAKAEVREGVRRRWGPSVWDAALAGLRGPECEAAYDAAAVGLCALEQPLVRALIEERTGA